MNQLGDEDLQSSQIVSNGVDEQVRVQFGFNSDGNIRVNLNINVGTGPQEQRESSSSTVQQENVESNVNNNESVYEIYKNGWLKKNPTFESRRKPFMKVPKPEKFWVIFCVHDDKEPKLEFYDNRRSAYSHKPIFNYALMNCLHISPSIVASEEDYEFVITLDKQVVRLAATSREQMTEWLDTIREKLRDLGILEPKDNIYSKEPLIYPKRSVQIVNNNQVQVGVTPRQLRDPNSPLPPVPNQIDDTVISTESPVFSSPVASGMSVSRNIFSFDFVTSALYNRNGSSDRVTTNEGSHLNRVRRDRSPTEPGTPVVNSLIYESVFPNLATYTSASRVNRCRSESEASGEARRPETNFARSVSSSDNQDYSVSEVVNTFSRSPLISRETSSQHGEPSFSGQFAETVDPESASGSSVYVVNPPPLDDRRPMSLKESQVLRLQKEIAHKGGVRLMLRKKDCVNALALVEAFGNIWIAGWKQKDHPLLHNTFHIGDQVFSIAGCKVTSVSEAHKTIKHEPLSVEFIIHRVPFGQVFAIKREFDGQDLGLVRDGNTAEISEVKHNGLAARHGLPVKAPAVQGDAQSNWVLTEINHRPLNLFSKNSEIQDRLNAVGKDISILVQPYDFIKIVKKQLKGLRNYKEYIVQ
ncbi:uncharacterized protein LOC143239071 [Tachypleus tridentatus]|uniref:uncharacterized protein LOC143239071 n=1 Tax=Tachypleus tridentatus TaxID=6853 RepID=UPI003FD08A54